MRFVFDTNVIVSALLFTDSPPGQAVLAALARGTLLLSDSVVEELSEVLARDKFNRYVILEERQRFLGALVHEAELVEITESVQVCRDPQDDKILELAVSGSATHVVTGDRDLLTLGSFRGIPIIKAAELLRFLESLGDTPNS